MTSHPGLLSPLVDPALDPVFWQAHRIGEHSAWWRHVPFAHWIVEACAPGALVELGTHAGVSYAAFCHAVQQAGLPTRCWAIDTWKGDEHAGAYDESVFTNLRTFNEAHFAAFSGLLRSTFDEALPRFVDSSIDLLHIDGLHTYEAVKHDFESWLPKLSERAVVLFHDTNVIEGDFGVWRLFSELRGRYPAFEFLHGHGLGVVGVGSQLPAGVAALLQTREPAEVGRLRHRFAWLGERWLAETRERMIAVDLGTKAATAETAALEAKARAAEAMAELGRVRGEAIETAERAAADARRHAAETARLTEAADHAAERAAVDARQHAAEAARLTEAADRAAERAAADARQHAAEAARLTEAAERELAARRAAEQQLVAAEAMRSQAAQRADRTRQQLEAERAAAKLLADQVAATPLPGQAAPLLEQAARPAVQVHVAQLTRELAQARHVTAQIADSTVWKATWPVRRASQALPPTARRVLRGVAEVGWWSATLSLKRKLAERRAVMAGLAQPAAARAAPVLAPVPASALVPAPVPPPLPPSVRPAEPEAVRMEQAAAPGDVRRAMRLVYVSGEYGTPGHRYRVERPAAAARLLGADVTVVPMDQVAGQLAAIAGADVLMLWRTPWGEAIADAVATIRRVGGKVVFDVDDLMIDPALASLDVIDGIRTQHLTEAMVESHYAGIRQAMQSADLCTASSEELAAHMRKAWMPARVLLNGFDHDTFAASRLAARCWARARDGLLRIGYAGGSRTHQRDFALCADAVGQALREHPDARLVVFRSRGTPVLDIEEFPALHGLDAQLEWREFVPLERLPEEVARFDVNLAPLEVGNPFCEAKSELKYFEAALVDVPTVASPTGPYRRAIRNGETGFLAETPAQWQAALTRLLDDAALRRQLTAAARRDVAWRFGPEARVQEMANLLDHLSGGRRAAEAFERGVLRAAVPAWLKTASARIPGHQVMLDHDALGVAEVTVIVPLHNYAAMVIEALDSVARQTLHKLDLIIVDDASTDDSLAAATSWAEANKVRFNRLRVVRNRVNAGLALTRNVAFDLADTPWVLPLDADNRLAPGCAAECLAIAKRSGAAYVYPVLQQFGMKADLMGATPYDPVRLSNGNYIDAMALISRAAWAGAGGYNHVVGGWEDFDLWCRFAEGGLRGEAALGQPLGEYRVHGTSMIQTASGSAERMDAMIASLQKRHPWLTIVWPLLAPRPGAAVAAPPQHAVAVKSGPNARVEALLPLLRCPKSGTGLALAPDGTALVSETGITWPLVAGRPNLFAGLAAPAVNPDSHVSNALPENARALTRAAQGRVLHLSAGGSSERFDNVIEAEAAVFRNTDVLADAHHLPFADGVFEAVVAMNAFEHYRNPPQAAQEILRVLAPGGRVLIRTAFLQPEHEAPWHFYNCTRFGLEAWFEGFETEELIVSANFHPGYSVAWLASECEMALRSCASPQAAERFARTSMGEFAALWRTRDDARPQQDVPSWSDLAALPQDAQQKIAAGFEFSGRKPL